MKKALYKRSEDPLQWFSSKMGLSVDTSCHAVAAVLLGIGILEWAEWYALELNCTDLCAHPSTSCETLPLHPL